VDVDVAAGRDVLAGEADNLTVLVDRLALPDVPQGDFVPQADPPGQLQGAPVMPDLQPGLEVAGGDGDVIFRSEVDGNLGQRHGRHESSPQAIKRAVVPSRYRRPPAGANAGRGSWVVPDEPP
jgi:hypothetical protein